MSRLFFYISLLLINSVCLLKRIIWWILINLSNVSIFIINFIMNTKYKFRIIIKSVCVTKIEWKYNFKLISKF